ncbi:MAG: hypothetical protein HY014_08705 [Acidobacteria bacterium]|nr:hypothetical protein [Acidobacteriota bacterium]MBI3488233.1 hypothetical protein [Acidobacteriota bacterium]
MTKRRNSTRIRQQGGLTIILALVLVGVMGAATFSLSRNAIRELSTAGAIIQGGKAAAAADAGLDWVIIWGQGGVKFSDFTAAAPHAEQSALISKMKDSISPTLAYPIFTLSGNGVDAMSMNVGSATTNQNFDIEFRFLGNLPSGRQSGGSSDNAGASGGTKGGAGGVGDYVWRILATGRATPQNGQTYQAQRELISTLPPF